MRRFGRIGKNSGKLKRRLTGAKVNFERNYRRSFERGYRKKFAVMIACCFVLILGIECTKMQDIEVENSGKVGKLVFELEKESYKVAVKIVENVVDVPELDGNGSNYISSKASGWGTRFVLDTTKYLLQISDNKGNIYYDGLYVQRPSEMELPVGTYHIKLRSGEFTEPSKDLPLFGEDRTVKAVSDSTLRVNLISAQLTGGIRVLVTDNFRKFFKGNGLYYVKDSAQYRQSYYGTNLYVFFYPGDVKIVYKNKDGSGAYTPPTNPSWEDTTILTHKLKATDLVSIELDYDITRANTGGFSMSIDTNRVRTERYYNTAFFAPYGSVSVVYARTHIGDSVKLWGYIVGGNATSSNFQKRGLFTSKTHIVLAKEDWQSLRENVMAVELPIGTIRNELNLVDHPNMVGRKIVVDGVVVDSYFGYAGLKNVTSYKLY